MALLDAFDLDDVGFQGLINEDVLQQIWDISAIPLPFTQMIGSDTIGNASAMWTTDELSVPNTDNAVVDGSDAGADESTLGLRVGNKARAEVKAMGLALFPDDSCASNTVTAVRAPEGLDVRGLLKILREEHDVVLAGGQQRLDGKIFRIGHLGHVSEADIDEVAAALRVALPRAGYAKVG